MEQLAQSILLGAHLEHIGLFRGRYLPRGNVPYRTRPRQSVGCLVQTLISADDALEAAATTVVGPRSKNSYSSKRFA